MIGASTRLFIDEQDEIAEISRLIASNFEPGKTLSILEAGCGRQWRIGLPDNQVRLTGVDLSSDALMYRTQTVGDLDEVIHGDLAVVDLPRERYDVTYSAYVLEHVRDASTVVERFDTCTRAGGLIVLRLPDRDSVFGVIARRTPFPVHIWFYRYVLGDRLAGTEGRGPFPAHYSKGMGGSELRTYFLRNGYELLGEGLLRPFPGKSGAFWWMVRAAIRAIGRFTHGHFAGDHTNFFVVARKRGGP